MKTTVLSVDQGNRKRRCSVSSETQSLIFGIYFLFKSLVVLVLGIAAFESGHVLLSENRLIRQNGEREARHSLIYSYVAFTVALTGLLFSALLIIGVKKRKTGLILSFFIYGLVMLTLSFIVNMIYFIFFAAFGLQLNPSRLGVFVVQIISIVGLVVVFRTYKKITIEAAQSAHSRLSES